MLIWGISWVWYLITILGVGGTIAFFVLDTAMATMVFKWLLRFLWETRLGWALVAGFFMFELADILRSRSDQADFAARTAAFEQAQQARDQKIADDTRAAVTEELKQQAAADQKTDTDNEDFKKDLPPVPATGNLFAVGTDACKLRVISGQTCSPDSSTAPAMLKAGTKSRSPQHRRK